MASSSERDSVREIGMLRLIASSSGRVLSERDTAVSLIIDIIKWEVTLLGRWIMVMSNDVSSSERDSVKETDVMRASTSSSWSDSVRETGASLFMTSSSERDSVRETEIILFMTSSSGSDSVREIIMVDGNSHHQVRETLLGRLFCLWK